MPAQDADASFRPRVVEPAFSGRPRPRLAIDQGHGNFHTAGGRYSPFARLMDARRVPRDCRAKGRITAEALRDVDVFVTANALGYKGMAQQFANIVGLERIIRFECRRVRVTTRSPR